MEFDVEKTVNYWRESAEYDLETANALFEKKRFPYALFMGHLALEKLLKGLFVKDNQSHVPWIHSLPILASKLKIKISDEILGKLGEFMEFHFEG
ncbi:MAG: HEPN domain-containing protein [Nitrospirota bacterium]